MSFVASHTLPRRRQLQLQHPARLGLCGHHDGGRRGGEGLSLLRGVAVVVARPVRLREGFPVAFALGGGPGGTGKCCSQSTSVVAALPLLLVLLLLALPFGPVVSAVYMSE